MVTAGRRSRLLLFEEGKRRVQGELPSIAAGSVASVFHWHPALPPKCRHTPDVQPSTIWRQNIFLGMQRLISCAWSQNPSSLMYGNAVRSSNIRIKVGESVLPF